MEEKKPVEQPSPQPPPKPEGVQLSHGNIEVVKIKLLDSIAGKLDEVIGLLRKSDKK